MISRTLLASASVIGFVSFACSSSSSPPQSSSGSIDGVSLGAQSAIAASSPIGATSTVEVGADGGVISSTGTSEPGVLIAISSSPSGTCSSFPLANTAALLIEIPGTGTVGTYPTGGAAGAGAQFGKIDSTCKASNGAKDLSGTITITSSSATTLVGSYDLTSADGHLTGSFNAPICSSNPLNGVDGGDPVCH